MQHCATCECDSLWDADLIVQSVAARMGTSAVEIRSACRDQHLVEARREVERVMREKGYGPSEIGRAINKDHSTIIHYRKTA